MGESCILLPIPYSFKNEVETNPFFPQSFYYVDERTADGGAAGNDVDGPAHADFFSELASKTEVVDYLQTFVKGQGYVKF